MIANANKPAFPLENPRSLENDELFRQFPGLTKREFIASQLAGHLAAEGRLMEAVLTGRQVEAVRNIAALSVMLADAILDRIQQTPEGA